MAKRPGTYTALEALGRERLSRHFQMRNFMHSEIANFFERSNYPDTPDLALAAGRKLAQNLLDPLVETFGPIDIRSGYRSPSLNHFGASQVKPQKCARNEVNYAHHIWDMRDAEGRMGACVSVAIPWFSAQYNRGRDWRDLGWWLFDHLDFQEIYFFPKDAAFNITWREGLREQRILSYIRPKGTLMKPGLAPDPERHKSYTNFPPFRGISYPEIPDGASR